MRADDARGGPACARAVHGAPQPGGRGGARGPRHSSRGAPGRGRGPAARRAGADQGARPEARRGTAGPAPPVRGDVTVQRAEVVSLFAELRTTEPVIVGPGSTS